jgi:TetR/AcrR family transcriptional regulator, transcriptional repressor for nem operon
MARPREFDEGAVLDRAAGVFRAKGFEGASVSDLEKATGLCRASLYGAFRDKRFLYLAALRRYDASRAAALFARLDAQKSGRQAVKALFETVLDECAEAHGCLLAEASVADPRAARCVADSRRRTEGAIHAALLRGEADGSVKRTADAGAAARFLFAAALGLRALSKAGCTRAQLREVAEMTLEVL